jgi:hypothetical protein
MNHNINSEGKKSWLTQTTNLLTLQPCFWIYD